jgi:hypothetical protein
MTAIGMKNPAKKDGDSTGLQAAFLSPAYNSLDTHRAASADRGGSWRPLQELTMDTPAERRFDRYSDYRLAMLEALGIATQTVAILDPDLKESGLESRSAIALLEALLRGSPRDDALRIVVHSTAFVERECPLLLALIGAFRPRLDVRVTSPSFRAWTRPFLIADARHVVTRFDQDGPRGKFCIDDLRSASSLLIQFETMWMAGESTATGIPLGL